jgi:hypothetical protein
VAGDELITPAENALDSLASVASALASGGEGVMNQKGPPAWGWHAVYLRLLLAAP